MSDSDDTDVLLLIPPDFFFVAPSPSPASSPLTVTPPSPIDHSLFKSRKLSLTEQQAANSLKEITAQLRLIERRLSVVESQRSGSMDGENSSVWYDLENYETDSSGYHPERSGDRQSINVRKLLQATAKYSKGLNHPQDNSFTHSWGPPSLKYPLSQCPKRLTQEREGSSRVLLRDGNDEDDVVRERRASSLPPTPSSRHLYRSPPTKQANPHPYSDNYKEGTSREVISNKEKALRSELEPGRSQERENANRYNEYSEERTGRPVREPGKKPDQVEQRENTLKKVSDQKVSHAPDEGQSFNSNSLDGTLGISVLLPMMSTLGLSGSLVFPSSLEETKATDCSIGGPDGGFTLAQVEKLLQDMQKTQTEMEKSMRGMKKLGRNEKENVVDCKFLSDLEGKDDLRNREQKDSREVQLSDVEEGAFESKGNKMDYGKEANKRDQITKGGTQGVPLKPSIAPVRIVVEESKVNNESQLTEVGSSDFEEMEGNAENQSNRKGYPIYKSKSEESISEKCRRTAVEDRNNKCVGTESVDDSFIRDGRLTPSHTSGLGNTIGSVPDLGLGVREMFAKTSEKHQGVAKHPSKGSEKPHDIVKEPPFVKKNISLLGSGNPEVEMMENNSISGSSPTADKIVTSHAPSSFPGTVLRHEMDRGEEIAWNRGRNREEGGNLEGRFQKHKEEMMGPVMVVGGDGSRKVQREVSKREREEDRGQNKGGRCGQRNDGRGDVEGLSKVERDVADEPDGERRRRWIGGREGRRSDQEKYGQGSLDGRKDKYTRYRDSGYGESAKSFFGSIPQMPAHRLFHTTGAWAVPLTSDIDTTAGPEGIVSLLRKLEEEKFRREHCERVIEEVGRRALEAQERLAVSEGMSKAKDVALGKFHDAWEEAVSGWKREGDARKALEKEVERYRERMNEETAFGDKRIKQLEGDVMQLGEESHFLREELRKGQRETAEITARLSAMLEVATKEVSNCRKESECALMKEARAKEEASKASEASREAKEKWNEAVKKVDYLESEKNMMKQEIETFQGKLKDFISRIATLESRLADAEVAADKAQKSEKSLVENFTLAQKEWEKERMKLKDFYQSQVEELVRTKVNEFQSQLDAVEHSLRKEAEIKEEEAKKLGEERLRMLNEKHTQEVTLLEQKHGEEISLWSLRLKRAMEEVDSLKHHVSKYNAQKSQLAKGLHSLMQAQLRQGLRLIASGGEIDQDATLSPPKKIEKPTLETSWREVMASFNIPEKTDVLPEKEYHSKKVADYSREKHLQSKERADNELILSGRNRTSVLPNSDLKKYIHMLLGQEPGKPMGIRDISSESEDDCERHVLESKGKQYLTKQMSTLGTVDDEPKLVAREKRRARKERTKVAEKEDACKLPRDVPVAVWEAVGLKLGQPTSIGNVVEEYPNDQENRRTRKPPWK